ncbi:MAG: NAD(+) diphosphatase [Treponema sp.]|jgi:NAD+ diphosphatase|nr:NAD(+) diphosphatase [Treponema sp.]
MNSSEGQEVYCFQGDSLVIPADTPDSRLNEGVSEKAAREELEIDEIFEIPAVDMPGNIRGVNVRENAALPASWKAVPMRQAVNLLTYGMTVDGRGPVGRLLRSFHISQWRKESAYCGSCGSRNSDSPSEPARLCPVCGRLEFPRISPAVITIIINDRDEALLAHNRKFAAGVYSLIAGFNEAGENLEATVAREIREEVGLEVKDIRYLASQPWPFPNSLMLGFTARHAGGEIRCDQVEIEDAQWFSRDGLPRLPGNGSVSRFLINSWREGKL